VYRIPGENLWLGHVGHAADLRALHDAGIVAVVDLALNEPPVRLTREMVYCRVPLLDGVGNPPWLLRMAVDVVVGLLRARTPTLLHCSAGLSRAPAVAACALAVGHDRDPDECLQELARSRTLDVSPGLWQELLGLLQSAPPRPEGPPRLT
jgi:protein-tyrosine phosphatase